MPTLDGKLYNPVIEAKLDFSIACFETQYGEAIYSSHAALAFRDPGFCKRLSKMHAVPTKLESFLIHALSEFGMPIFDLRNNGFMEKYVGIARTTNPKIEVADVSAEQRIRTETGDLMSRRQRGFEAIYVQGKANAVLGIQNGIGSNYSNHEIVLSYGMIIVLENPVLRRWIEVEDGFKYRQVACPPFSRLKERQLALAV